MLKYKKSMNPLFSKKSKSILVTFDKIVLFKKISDDKLIPNYSRFSLATKHNF